MNDPRPSRRIVFHGLSALGVAAVLAGCGGDDKAVDAPPSDNPPTSPSTAGTSPGATSSPATPQGLVATADVPVGGGVIFPDQKVVVTQPAAGTFKAFTSVCPHQGNPVGSIEDGTITCHFHGSQFDAATGDVTNGPATSGLAEKRIRVEGGQIFLA